MVFGFDFEADARNFTLLQSLYMNVDILSVLQRYRRKDLYATKSQARCSRGEHFMLHVFHDNQTKGANVCYFSILIP